MRDVSQLITFYENEGREELRLQKDGAHYLEFLTATAYLKRHLPANCSVLDSCAGTGAYAFFLAQAGHQVTCCDIVPYNVETIKQKQAKNPVLANILCADALNLHMLSAHSFQAVLCMGALYHLRDSAKRERAVEESLRLLQKNGLFICTYLNRYAVAMQNLQGSLSNIDEILHFIEDGQEGIFYASTPGELEELMQQAGISKVCHLALDGISALLHQLTNRINNEGLKQFHKYHMACCEEPSLLGYSYHNMFIGKVAR